MAKKKETDENTGLVRQFDDMKKKHPDAMLLFRTGDFYEIYRQDAVKAAAILAITLTDRIIPGEKEPMKMTMFPYNKLDTYLPKLIRAGTRVAICDKVEDPKLTKMAKEGVKKEQTQSNHSDMAKKKKEQAAQEEPVRTVKNAAGEKPAKEEKTGTAVKTKDGEEAKEKQERKPREPQMVTANGEKVTHGHAYQSKTNPEEWYFTAKMDGQQLKPQRMDAADLAAVDSIGKIGVEAHKIEMIRTAAYLLIGSETDAQRTVADVFVRVDFGAQGDYLGDSRFVVRAEQSIPRRGDYILPDIV